jgi:hypothetical protein
MARSGQTIENPTTRERIVFQQTARDTSGALMVADLFVGRGGFVAVEHVHPRQEERLIVKRGAIRFRLAGREQIYTPGEPALNFDEFLETVFGLTRDGWMNGTGGPRNLFQAAALLAPVGRLLGYREAYPEYVAR